MSRVFCVLVALAALCLPASAEQILYQSATLGQTGVSWEDLTNGAVPGANLSPSVFNGVRFRLKTSVVTTQVGGHFVGATESIGESFFGAIVQLTGPDDFPDSTNLSTPDVLGATLLEFPSLSTEIFGDLSLALQPGDYALVFGSGLFEATGRGGAILNNLDIGSPEYIVSTAGSNGFSVPINPNFKNYRFVLKGVIVPEPGTHFLALMALAYGAFRLNRIATQ